MVAQHAAYRRFEAPARLSSLVEHVWVTHLDGSAPPEVGLPDGRGLLLIVHGAPTRVSHPLSGAVEEESTSLRGPALDVVVRDQRASAIRLGVQLAPVALGRLRLDRARPGEVAELLGVEPLAQVDAKLADGDDQGAVDVVLDALASAPRTDSDEADRLAEVFALAESERGLVRSTDLARRAGVPIGELHRWSVHLIGVAPAAWLSAVRFSAFVRESVGQGPVRPRAVLAAISWYAQAGYSPRETSRFTGLPPVELRRLVDKLHAALDAG